MEVAGASARNRQLDSPVSLRYFQHAKFIRQNCKNVVQVQFQDLIVMVKGKGLEPLCDALERINVFTEKYERLGKIEGVIKDIEIKNIAVKWPANTNKFLYCFSILFGVFMSNQGQTAQNVKAHKSIVVVI